MDELPSLSASSKCHPAPFSFGLNVRSCYKTVASAGRARSAVAKNRRYAIYNSFLVPENYTITAFKFSSKVLKLVMWELTTSIPCCRM